MSNNAATFPTHEQIVASFIASPILAAINYTVDGVEVSVRRSAIDADARLGSIVERIERMVPFAAAYGEKVVVD
jgi:hypothetical protein